MPVRIGILGFVLAIGLSACQSAPPPRDLVTPKLNLPAMGQPQVRQGKVWYGWEAGGVQGQRIYNRRLVALDGNKATYVDARGCRWTQHPWSFAPALSWRDCPSLTDAFQQITAVEGEIWPLALGKQVTYHFKGHDMRGGVWSGTRACRVADEVEVRTAIGSHEVYQVVCDDPWRQNTWYVSPARNEVVLQLSYQKPEKRLFRWELTEVTRPDYPTRAN